MEPKFEDYEVLAGNAIYHNGELAEVGQIIQLTPDQAVTHGTNIRLYTPAGDTPPDPPLVEDTPPSLPDLTDYVATGEEVAPMIVDSLPVVGQPETRTGKPPRRQR